MTYKGLLGFSRGAEGSQILIRAKLKLPYFNYQNKEKKLEAAGWTGERHGL